MKSSFSLSGLGSALGLRGAGNASKKAYSCGPLVCGHPHNLPAIHINRLGHGSHRHPQERITAAMRSAFARSLFVIETLSAFPDSARTSFLKASSCLRTPALSPASRRDCAAFKTSLDLK